MLGIILYICVFLGVSFGRWWVSGKKKPGSDEGDVAIFKSVLTGSITVFALGTIALHMADIKTRAEDVIVTENKDKIIETYTITTTDSWYCPKMFDKKLTRRVKIKRPS